MKEEFTHRSNQLLHDLPRMRHLSGLFKRSRKMLKKKNARVRLRMMINHCIEEGHPYGDYVFALYTMDIPWLVKHAIKFTVDVDEFPEQFEGRSHLWFDAFHEEEEHHLPFDVTAVDFVIDGVAKFGALMWETNSIGITVSDLVKDDLWLGDKEYKSSIVIWGYTYHKDNAVLKKEGVCPDPIMYVLMNAEDLSLWESRHEELVVQGDPSRPVMDYLIHPILFDQAMEEFVIQNMDEDKIPKKIILDQTYFDLAVEASSFGTVKAQAVITQMNELYRERAVYVARYLWLLNQSNIVYDYKVQPKHPPSFAHGRVKPKPFYEYRVLKLDPTAPRVQHIYAGPKKFRRPPKAHLRRKHKRTLHDGREVWVSAAHIGSKKKGFIHKEYQLEKDHDAVQEAEQLQERKNREGL